MMLCDYIRIITGYNFEKKKKLSYIAAVAMLLILPQLFFAQTQSAAELIDIKLERPGDRLNVQIETTGTFSFRSFVLKEPNRLVIDLDQVFVFHSQDIIEVRAFGVKNIRVGKNQPQITRIVFDLEESLPSYKISKNTAGILVTFQLEKEKEVIPISKIKHKILFPEIEKKPTQSEENKMRIGLGIHSGLYFSFEKYIKDNYGKNSMFTGGEAALIFPLRDSNSLGISLSFLYIEQEGINPEEYIRMRMTPVSLSVSFQKTYKKVTPYIGGGIDYINYSENSPLAYEEQLISRKVLGANLQIGTYIKSTSFLSFKIYAIFHFARLKEDLLNIKMSGVEAGLSLNVFFRIIPSKI